MAKRFIDTKMWDKEPEEIKTVSESKYGYDSVKERDIDRRLDILWGMAFNNATRVVCADSQLKAIQKVELIEQIMPDMFKIAKGLELVLKDEQNKKQKEDEDDLPF